MPKSKLTLRLLVVIGFIFASAGLMKPLHISFAHPLSRLPPAIIPSILIPFSLWLDGHLSFKKTSQ